VDEVNTKLIEGFTDITKRAKHNSPNLTQRERSVYITEVDKGSAILILNSCDVDRVIEENLENTTHFSSLDNDH